MGQARAGVETARTTQTTPERGKQLRHDGDTRACTRAGWPDMFPLRPQLVLFLGLVAVIPPMGQEPARTSQGKQIAVIDVSGESSATEPRRDIGRPFDQSGPCSQRSQHRRSSRTVRGVSGGVVIWVPIAANGSCADSLSKTPAISLRRSGREARLV